MSQATDRMTDEQLDLYVWTEDVKDAMKHKTTRDEYIAMHKPGCREKAAQAWDYVQFRINHKRKGEQCSN